MAVSSVDARTCGSSLHIALHRLGLAMLCAPWQPRELAAEEAAMADALAAAALDTAALPATQLKEAMFSSSEVAQNTAKMTNTSPVLNTR